MIANALQVSRQSDIPAFLVLCVRVIDKGVQRYFGVYDQVSCLVQMQNNIRLHPPRRFVGNDDIAVRIAQELLRVIFQSPLQTDGMQQTLDFLFTPVSLRLVLRRQRVTQPLCAVTHFHRRAHQRRNLLFDSLRRGLLCGLVLFERGLHFRDTLFQRIHNLFHVRRVRLLQLRLTLFQHLVRHVLHLLSHGRQSLLVPLLFGLNRFCIPFPLGLYRLHIPFPFSLYRLVMPLFYGLHLRLMPLLYRLDYIPVSLLFGVQ